MLVGPGGLDSGFPRGPFLTGRLGVCPSPGLERGQGDGEGWQLGEKVSPPVVQGGNLSNVTINVNGLNSPNKDTDSRCPIIAVGKTDLKLNDSETEKERDVSRNHNRKENSGGNICPKQSGI